MSVILNSVSETFNFVFYELCDHRTRDLWPSITPLVIILGVYLYWIKKVGPAWMKDKKPYELKNTIFVYNIIQIILSFYVFYEAIEIWMQYNWICQPVDYSTSPTVAKTIYLVRVYMTLKIIDLLDTVFFVLRKKDRQISALHIYHHFMMPICGFIGMKYYPTGHGILLGIINSFVHTVMYTYYLIAGLGPQYQKYLWWKKHVTTLQLVQFVIVFFHNFFPIFTDCDYPKWINVTLSICALHFVYMFGNFYYVNYIKNTKDHKKLNKRR